MQIKKLRDGEWIQEPGFYAISLERHHAQPCVSPDRLREIMDGDRPGYGEWSVTSGVLRKMELESPADHYAFSLLNPNRWGRDETDALRLGAAMAYLVEGGVEALLEAFEVHPEDKPRKPTAAQIEAYDAGKITDANKASVEYWRAVDNSPSRFLTKAEFENLTAMFGVLQNDPAALAVMGGVPEVTMAWKDEETGLWLLSRPDTVSFDGALTDYKRMASQNKPFNHRLVDQRITDHAYDMQLGFGADVFERLTGNRPEVVAVVAQADKAPHHVILREIIAEDLSIASFRNRRAIRRFAECLASGRWPGPGDDVGFYRRPEWQREQIINQMQTEGTAP